jgi:hypothetical protein
MLNRKQKQIYVGLTVGVAVIILLSIFFLRSKEVKMKKHVNKKDGYSMKYPVKWKKYDNYNGTSVTFVAQKNTALDTFNENVNIVVQDLSRRPLSLNKYTEVAVGQMKAIFKDSIEILEAESRRFGGKNGFLFSYKGKLPDGGAAFYAIHYWTIKDDIAYQFTYMALEAEADDPFYGLVKKMVGSFKIL